MDFPLWYHAIRIVLLDVGITAVTWPVPIGIHPMKGDWILTNEQIRECETDEENHFQASQAIFECTLDCTRQVFTIFLCYQMFTFLSCAYCPPVKHLWIANELGQTAQVKQKLWFFLTPGEFIVDWYGHLHICHSFDILLIELHNKCVLKAYFKGNFTPLCHRGKYNRMGDRVRQGGSKWKKEWDRMRKIMSMD